MDIIARIYNDFNEKFGIPRQSGIVDEMESHIIFENKYRNPDSVKGLEEYDYIWLIWGFSENKTSGFKAAVRPPKLGGNIKKGVFATRSSFRPNGLGLSSVKLLSIEKSSQGMILKVTGADLMNGTPIYDIKPYLAYTDSHPEAKCGFADEAAGYSIEVHISEELLNIIPEDKRNTFLKILENDPRPAYHKDGNRVYGLNYAGYNIRFIVEDGVLIVKEVEKKEGNAW
ncbi:MAG: tRNA (N6-threonylcarbamoyladenosine(37)-N6)-methyltransferase TrmO [Lachnospiraceae bacterium]|nr:tRNA (N6-threonylcarbamoyladenosine(37)-N6)-methyltransferase TrmO [Lachnospiraceae bacterium]